MKHVSTVLRVSDLKGGGRILLAWCPGCDRQHAWYVADDDGRTHHGPGHTWTWDSNIERPTIGPSLLVHPHGGDPPQPLCHSFLNAGVWDFLGDCTHQLAGQKVEMVPLPDWLASIDEDDQS